MPVRARLCAARPISRCPSRSSWLCRKGPGEYTIGIANNTWREQPFRVESLCGKLESLRELPLDTSEAGAPGQTPEVVDGSKLGKNSANTIAGGDVRIFAVKVQVACGRRVKQTRPSGANNFATT